MDTKTLTQRLSELKSEGYTTNFSIEEDSIINRSNNSEIEIDEFEVDNFYRFEGMTNPSDSSILYAIKTKSGVKGTLVEGYGVSSTISRDMAKKIKR